MGLVLCRVSLAVPRPETSRAPICGGVASSPRPASLCLTAFHPNLIHYLAPHHAPCPRAPILPWTRFLLGANGYKVHKYVPYGHVGEVIPYLLRRAQENSAVLGTATNEIAMMQKELARRTGLAGRA